MHIFRVLLSKEFNGSVDKFVIQHIQVRWEHAVAPFYANTIHPHVRLLHVVTFLPFFCFPEFIRDANSLRDVFLRLLTYTYIFITHLSRHPHFFPYEFFTRIFLFRLFKKILISIVYSLVKGNISCYMLLVLYPSPFSLASSVFPLSIQFLSLISSVWNNSDLLRKISSGIFAKIISFRNSVIKHWIYIQILFNLK